MSCRSPFKHTDVRRVAIFNHGRSGNQFETKAPVTGGGKLSDESGPVLGSGDSMTYWS